MFDPSVIRAMMRIILLSLTLCLTGCRDRPPAPTKEQAAQLNEAEDMLNDLATNKSGQPNVSNAASDTNATTISNGTENRNHAP